MNNEYSPWHWHHKAMREHPEYQMLGLMDCLREEMMLNMPVISEQVPLQTVREEPFNKRQWDMVQQLRADQINLRKTLYDTLKEIKERAKASKRKTTRYKEYK